MHQAFLRHVDCTQTQALQPTLLPLTAAAAAAASVTPSSAFHPGNQKLNSSITDAVS
jgi:hypothetical protein